VIYHELGHNYYQRAYNKQPMLFRDGAHGGFHEAIGDTITLSMTPEYLAEVGLVASAEQSQQAIINQQMQQALDKIAFLPFGKLIDEWRWGVFSGEIAPENYNQAWWDLRLRYQGIAPPVERSEADFDPGAKYHVPGNVSYTRYFLARILQFQFQRSLCEAAGHEGDLYACSIYGSKAAGDRLTAMLEAGASEPWPDTLEKLTGTREMDATAIIDYFQPLMGYLKEQNEGRSCGW
jgi:peptidyl-dipeptidase A